MALETSTIALSDQRTVNYATSGPLDPQKTTLFLIHSFTTNVNLFAELFANAELVNACNLLAVDTIGHGKTQTRFDEKGWTFGDNAQMCLDVMDKLNVREAFVLGVSQGGFTAPLMALIAPERILGVILAGSSVYAETPETVEWGCWDAPNVMGPVRKQLESEQSNPDFVIHQEQLDGIIGFFGPLEKPQKEFWENQIIETYKGEAGRKKFRGAVAALVDREGLEEKVKDITAPVLIIHGTEDAVLSVKAAEKTKEAFTGAPVCELEIIEGGAHYLSASHPRRVTELALRFIKKHAGKSVAKGHSSGDAGAPSETAGMKEEVLAAELGRAVLGGSGEGKSVPGEEESEGPLAS